MVVKRVVFGHIDEVEGVLLAFSHIAHFEEEPLGVIADEVVWPDHEIVFIVADFQDSTEITAFEPAFKDESFIV